MTIQCGPKEDVCRSAFQRWALPDPQKSQKIGARLLGVCPCFGLSHFQQTAMYSFRLSQRQDLPDQTTVRVACQAPKQIP